MFYVIIIYIVYIIHPDIMQILSGITQLVVTGMMTNQCVESAVRDATDLGFLVTVPEETCVTESQQDHDHSLKTMQLYSRICHAAQVIQETMNWAV